jgi:GNAT superfamily N-acetyltransferase
METQAGKPAAGVTVRAMNRADVDDADRIFRVAFGTFLRMPDPMQFAGDADYVRSRFGAFPDRAFVAERNGQLLGSNFASRWGSFGFLGPLTTRPEVWDQGIGRRLLEPVMEKFSTWELSFAGLFTFAESPKHIGLYQRYGFWPRMLTAIMVRPVPPAETAGSAVKLATLNDDAREAAIRECARITDELYPGLDVSDEIRAVYRLRLGDTILLRDYTGIAAFAVCHWGPQSEGGTGTCYVKFAAARPGPSSERDFKELIAAVDATARSESLNAVMAGVNAAREKAWRLLQSGGFKTVIQGVAMHRDNAVGYSHPGVFVLEDWR